MNTIILLSLQTNAILEISGLLLVAAIIGFVAAWLYSKSVYEEKIEALDSDLNEYKKQIGLLEADKKNRQKTITEKDKEIINLEKEVEALELLQAKAARQAADIKLKSEIAKQKLSEKDEALPNLKQGMHLLNYNSFGIATKEEKDDLKMISGIGPFIEERLHAVDIYTFRQISNFSAKDVDAINDAIKYFAGRIERDEWVLQAKELVSNKEKRNVLLQKISNKKPLIYYDRIGTAKKEEADDLTEISGIGGWINEKLNVLDIYTFRQIGNLNNDDIQLITDAIEYFPGRIERDEWVQQAREIIRTEISTSEHLERISVMKNRIYHDRLGVAHKHHANNLTLIKGISPWIEERLNMLEIYTFKQISNFTSEDIVIISDIIAISPNRIEQDRWIAQATELMQTNPEKMTL